MAESKQANELMTVDSGVKTALSSIGSNDIESFIEHLKSVHSFDEIVDEIKADAYEGRDSWVRTALLVHKGFENCSRAEMQKKTTEFESRLGYKKSQIYNFRNAGEKLLRKAIESKGKKFDVAINMSDFLREGKEKTATPRGVIDNIRKIGEFETAYKYNIYRGNLNVEGAKDNAKPKDVFFITATNLPENAKVNKVVSIVDGKENIEYTCGSEEIEIDGKKVTRAKVLTLRFYDLSIK